MNDKIQDESTAYFHYYGEFERVPKETTLTQSGKKFQFNLGKNLISLVKKLVKRRNIFRNKTSLIEACHAFKGVGMYIRIE